MSSKRRCHDIRRRDGGSVAPLGLLLPVPRRRTGNGWRELWQRPDRRTAASRIRRLSGRPLTATTALRLVCAALLLLCGCNGDIDNVGLSGGTLVVALPGDVDSWNPYTTHDATSAALLDLLYPRLVLERGGDDGRTEFEPWLAESWEFSTDRLSLTFRLRPAARWSDGSPVTCSDVAFTHRIQIADELAWAGAFIKSRISSVE